MYGWELPEVNALSNLLIQHDIDNSLIQCGVENKWNVSCRESSYEGGYLLDFPHTVLRGTNNYNSLSSALNIFVSGNSHVVVALLKTSDRSYNSRYIVNIFGFLSSGVRFAAESGDSGSDSRSDPPIVGRLSRTT